MHMILNRKPFADKLYIVLISANNENITNLLVLDILQIL